MMTTTHTNTGTPCVAQGGRCSGSQIHRPNPGPRYCGTSQDIAEEQACLGVCLRRRDAASVARERFGVGVACRRQHWEWSEELVGTGVCLFFSLRSFLCFPSLPFPFFPCFLSLRSFPAFSFRYSRLGLSGLGASTERRGDVGVPAAVTQLGWLGPLPFTAFLFSYCHFLLSFRPASSASSQRAPMMKTPVQPTSEHHWSSPSRRRTISLRHRVVLKMKTPS